MNGRPSASSMSWTVQICGWSSAEADRASRRKRSVAVRGQIVGEEPEGDEPAELDVLGLVDDAHPATADRIDDAIVALVMRDVLWLPSCLGWTNMLLLNLGYVVRPRLHA